MVTESDMACMRRGYIVASLRSDWEKCEPLEVFHGGVDVSEGEVRERVIRRDLERLCEYVGSVVGAVHAV